MQFDQFTDRFRMVLQERSAEPLTITEFVVAPAGFVETPAKPVIEFLQSLFAGRKPPDLIVTVGGPAATFARTHRQELFPGTPLLFTTTEVRHLRAAPLAPDEAAAAVAVDFTALIDDVLQLLPATEHVLVVTGAGDIGRFWHSELQENFAQYGGRLDFIWSHDLSYEQMLQKAAALPPRSAVLYLSSGTFATGGWQSEHVALADLATRANAPLFGHYSGWLGEGIVGGRLLYIDDLGDTAADAAARILRGESPAAIRIPTRGQGPPAFDARQLRRWNISEARLPQGSDVRFRPPTLWRDYRGEALAVLGALTLQSMLIVGLMYQRRARRKAEEEGRRNLDLAADASRRMTMAALTGSIGHELSQPLSSILHNAQAGEMLLASSRATPDTLHEILTDIRAANVRATQIIERHRAMLRHRELDRTRIDIGSVVRESLAMVAPDARRKQVAIDAPAPTEPCAVKGDPVLLQQVMVNVLMNAIEAMAETPPDRRRIQVHQQVERHGVTISIRDAGTGLPASIDGQLFEPFVTTKTNGIGIGLTIAKAIVDSHGGSLDAHNNPDGGATFAMTLPRDAKPESAGLVAASL